MVNARNTIIEVANRLYERAKEINEDDILPTFSVEKWQKELAA